MKSYFIEKNEFEKVEPTLVQHIKNGTGTILINNEDQCLLTAVIKNEISNFRQNQGELQFAQRAITIDLESKESTSEMYEECCTTIQTYANHWHIQTIKSSTADTNKSAIFNSIPEKLLIKAAVKCNMLKLSNVINYIISILMFLISTYLTFSICKSVALFKTFSSVIAFSMIIGFTLAGIVQYLLYSKMLSRKENWKSLVSILNNKLDNEIYNQFISQLSSELISQMPLVIIIDDHSALDKITYDIVRNITSSGHAITTGVLLWIAFKKGNSQKTELFADKSFPVRKYVASKVLSL